MEHEKTTELLAAIMDGADYVLCVTVGKKDYVDFSGSGATVRGQAALLFDVIEMQVEQAISQEEDDDEIQ